MFEKVELTVAVAAGATALISVVISVWQGLQARKHNKLSVMPHLTMERFLPGLGRSKRQCGIRISNKGTGPAIIRRFGIKVDDKLIEGERDDWKHATTILDIDDVSHYVTLKPEDALAAGETRWVLEIDELGSKEEKVTKVNRALPRLRVYVEYRSIYGTKGTLSKMSSESVSPTRKLRSWFHNWRANLKGKVEPQTSTQKTDVS